MLEPLAEVFGTLTDGRKRWGKRYALRSVMTVPIKWYWLA